jgi:hypothetical protein
VRRNVFASLLLLAAAVRPLAGQDIGDDLSTLATENAQRYVGPLARGLGHALTGGLVSSADPHAALGWSIGVRFVGALFEDSDKTFQVVAPASVTYQHPLFGSRTYAQPYGPGGQTTPTVAGEGDGVVLTPQGTFRTELIAAGRNPNDFNIEFLEGLNVPVAPFGVIDAAVGIGFGTQVMARIIPTIDLGGIVGEDRVGDVSAFGVGVMHNLTQWLPIVTPMWDVSVTLGTQKMNLGDYLEASGNTFGLVASAGVGPLSAYAHASSYKASVDIDYSITPDATRPDLPQTTTTVAFETEVERSTRLAIGAQLNLILVKLSAEYGMGDMKTISGRVAFGLR